MLLICLFAVDSLLSWMLKWTNILGVNPGKPVFFALFNLGLIPLGNLCYASFGVPIGFVFWVWWSKRHKNIHTNTDISSSEE